MGKTFKDNEVNKIVPAAHWPGADLLASQPVLWKWASGMLLHASSLTWFDIYEEKHAHDKELPLNIVFNKPLS